MKKLRLLLLIPCFLAFNNAQARILYVKAGSTATTNLGTSWANAYPELSAALNQAYSNINDTIFVAKGTYYPGAIPATGTNPRDKCFLLKNRASIFGGFAGTETSISQRVLSVANRSVLSGDVGVANDTSDNVYHVIIALEIDSLTTLDGFHIVGGNASGMGDATIQSSLIPRNLGGGVYSKKSKMIMRNITIDSNYATRGGAGINNEKSTIMLQNSKVINNRINGHDLSGLGGGAGIRNEASSPILNQVTIQNNYAYHVQGGGGMRNVNSSMPKLNSVDFINNYTEIGNEGDGGGGMYNADTSNVILQNVTFQDNATDGGGGGIYNDESSPNLSHVTFTGNSAVYGGGMENDGFSHAILNHVSFVENEASEDGGGMYNWKSSPILTNVKFIDNSATMSGGGLHNYNNSSPVMTNILFKGNSAVINGGAIYNRRNGNPTITNALIYNNSAGNRGGGIYNMMSNTETSSPILTNVTVANNSALVSAGGGFDDGLGTTKIRNCIITGNTAPNAPDIEAPIAMVAAAINSIILDNEFYFGGTTPPVTITGAMFVNPANGDYRLAAGSYAINKGDGTLYGASSTPNLSAITTDINGANRIMGIAIDLGAYETCTDTVKPTITITSNPALIVSELEITFTASVTNEGMNPTFEWFKNNVSIPNATASVYTASTTNFVNGDLVTAILTSSYSCANYDTAKSNAVNIIFQPIGIGQLTSNNTPIHIFPNPNSGSFTFTTQVKSGKKYQLSITDVSGRIVYQESIQSTTTELRKTIQLNKVFDSGIYFLSIGATDEQKQVVRFVIH